MLERLSERAQKVMAYANLEANRMGNDQLGTEHLLLGLVREGKGTGAGILKGLGVDLEGVANEVERVTPKCPARQMSKRTHTLEMRAVLEAAAEEADRWGDPTVGTEHLLLALVRTSTCAAAKTLEAHGVGEEALLEELDKRRRGGGSGGLE
ncbi:MAG: Clp protease N-terminal domain-containing protein [Phycisphaerae bacterium]